MQELDIIAIWSDPWVAPYSPQGLLSFPRVPLQGTVFSATNILGHKMATKETAFRHRNIFDIDAN